MKKGGAKTREVRVRRKAENLKESFFIRKENNYAKLERYVRKYK